MTVILTAEELSVDGERDPTTVAKLLAVAFATSAAVDGLEAATVISMMEVSKGTDVVM
jgi:hypothetical protein